jgi:hypothetical protein
MKQKNQIMQKLFNGLILFLFSFKLNSETFYLQPTKFAFFKFSRSDNTFSIEEDTDHRSRTYKIDIISKTKATYSEKNDTEPEYQLISDNAIQINDITIASVGEVIRIISICFLDKNGGNPRFFNLELADDFSRFTKSNGSSYGNFLTSGNIIESKPKSILDGNELKRLSKNEIYAYIYDAESKSISDNDIKIIKESNLRSIEWNSAASNCVVIAKRFVEGNVITRSEKLSLEKSEAILDLIAEEYRSYDNRIEDAGVKLFFRKYEAISSKMSRSYSGLIRSILSGESLDYAHSSILLKEEAETKYKTFKPFLERLKSVSESGVKNELQDFFRAWGVSKNEDLKSINNNSAVKINIGNKIVNLNESDWEILKQESEYSVNLSKKVKQKNEKYNQIVTIFNIEMTKDRKSGIKLSDNIYFEAFKTGLGGITIRIRIDKGSYWILSRQTFISNNDNVLSDSEYADESKALLLARKFDDEISNTVFMINKNF